MSGFVVIVALVAAAGVPYLAWTWIDRRRHGRAAQIHDDIAALGEDALPSSLHPVIDLDDCIGSGACVRACPEQEILGITDGRARLINPLACVGHGACLAACPVGAIKLVFGTATRGVELPRVTPPSRAAPRPPAPESRTRPWTSRRTPALRAPVRASPCSSPAWPMQCGRTSASRP